MVVERAYCINSIAPFPRRIPPVKSFVSVLNKSLIQVVRGGIVSSELIAFCINSMNSKTALNSINSAAQSIEPQQVAFDTMDTLLIFRQHIILVCLFLLFLLLFGGGAVESAAFVRVAANGTIMIGFGLFAALRADATADPGWRGRPPR